MNIGFVLDDGLDSPDGVQQYITTLGRWLRSEGHEVHYLVGQTSRKDIPNVHSIPKNIKVKFNGNTLSIPLPASSKKIKKVLNELQLDVIHVQVPYSPFFGAKVVRHASPKTAIIGTFHIFPYGILSQIGTRLLGLWLRRNLRLFDAHLSVSAAAQSFAKETFKIESTVVPNMVETSKFKGARQVKRSEAEVQILFLGRLVKRKGCHLLIDALSELHSKNPDAKFHLDIAGRGEMSAELLKKVNNSGLEEHVKFRGFVTEEDKAKLMQKADISVFPSYAGESFGIVLIEAMAAGSQVVLGGHNPGYYSVLGHDVPESIVNPHNTEEFADILYKLICDPNMRSSINSKQQLLVKRFDSATVGAQIIAAYTECIEQKRRG